METMQKTDFDISSTSNVNPVRKPILIESNNKKLYATIAIISAIALITIIVLMAVFLSKKNNKPKRNFARHFSKSDDLHQNIELLIGGNEVGKRRNLQEEEKIQILGTNFEEFNSTDAILYLDGKKIPFDKYLFIKSDSPVKINIKFRKKIETFKGMFSGCNRIEKISLINVEPDFISETTSMFENCSSLGGVNFTNTTLNKITSTSKMFQNCSNLTTLHLEDFSTYETKDMSKMFEGCSSFNDTSFIENLSTKNAEFLNEIFSGCSSIKSLKLTGYDTSNVKNMSGMFKGMSSLEELEISSFNTEKVEKMNEMFESCTSIQTLNLSNFNTEKVINMNGMFANCLKLIELDVTSFQLTRCNSTENMFSNTTRELMLSIEKNEELMKYAGNSWSEKYDEKSNITKVLLDILFLVDATGSMGEEIESVKNNIIYIAVNLLKYKTMEKYNLSLAAIFYRDPIDSLYDIHECFDFDINPLNFKNFVNNITADGGLDFPEDWAGAFNLAKNLSWRQNSTKFIIHIADAPGHGNDWYIYDGHPEEGQKNDEIITYFAKNNFSIAGFLVSDFEENSALLSFLRAQEIYKNNSNKNYFITEFSAFETDEDYFLKLVYASFQGIFVDNVEIIKKEVWSWYETKVGAHYYAYSPYQTGYSKVKGYITLPDKLNTNNGSRNAYISFGLSGGYYSIDTGIRNNETFGWCPYHYDVNSSNFTVFDNNCAPSETSKVYIELEVTGERKVIFSLIYKDSTSKDLKTFTEEIDASHILLLDEKNNKLNRFYRFASLVNTGKDDQNDNTYMLGGKFTELIIVKNNTEYSWGIDSDDIEASWKVSDKRINFSYTNNSETFDIYHKLPEE